MSHLQDKPKFHWRLSSTVALLMFIVIAGFFLLTEHQAHLYGALPYLLLALCLLVHVFGHGHHGDGDVKTDSSKHGGRCEH